MSWNTLYSQVKTVLDGISTIQEVSLSPKVKFAGYPAAYVVPSDSTGDYETTAENIRTYAFIVRVFHETKASGIEEAITALADVIDSIIDAFDQDDMNDSSTRILGQSLPARYTYINVWATPGEWSEIPGENLVMGEIRVRVRVSVDVT